GTVERQLAPDRARVEERRVDAGGPARLVLALEACRLFGRDGDIDRGPRLEMALHVEPTKQRGKVERCTAPGLPCTAGIAQADRLLEIHEGDAWIVGDPACRRPAAAAAELLRLDQYHLHTGGREGISGRAAGQPAANDRDVGLQQAALPGKRRHT